MTYEATVQSHQACPGSVSGSSFAVSVSQLGLVRRSLAESPTGPSEVSAARGRYLDGGDEPDSKSNWRPKAASSHTTRSRVTDPGPWLHGLEATAEFSWRAPGQQAVLGHHVRAGRGRRCGADYSHQVQPLDAGLGSLCFRRIGSVSSEPDLGQPDQRHSPAPRRMLNIRSSSSTARTNFVGSNFKGTSRQRQVTTARSLCHSHGDFIHGNRGLHLIQS